MRNRLPFSLLVAAAALLILASSLSLAEPDEPVPIPVASVTTGKLEAKIAETEAASELGEEAKKQLLDLYRKALENLKTAASDTQTAEEYARVVDTAPARIEALREAISQLLSAERIERWIELQGRDGRLRAQLFELGVVSEERIAENGSWMLHVDMPRDTAERLARLPGAEGETVRRQLLEARDRA